MAQEARKQYEGSSMDIGAFKDLAIHQRAIRAFDTSRLVDDAAIEQLITVAEAAPNGGNRQPWTFVVVRDAGVKAKLRAIYDDVSAAYTGGRVTPGTTPWSEVPVLIAVCAQRPASGDRGGPAMGPSVFPAVQNLLLAAHAMGLGSVLTTLWKSRESEVNQVLGIPDNIEVHAILPIGYPDRKYGRNHRKPMAEVTYRDTYGKAW
jgi:nitroreductase